MPPKAQKVVLKMKINKGILSRKLEYFFLKINHNSWRIKTITRGEKKYNFQKRLLKINAPHLTPNVLKSITQGKLT